jgi:hypothetical protein
VIDFAAHTARIVRRLANATATLPDGREVIGIFENRALRGGALGIAQASGPQFSAVSADLEDLEVGDPLQIDEQNLRIVEIEPDGTGMTVLYLKT